LVPCLRGTGLWSQVGKESVGIDRQTRHKGGSDLAIHAQGRIKDCLESNLAICQNINP
ncbi:hypothetical protein T11_13754, partial [Trichinella zimbabwensis]